MEYDENYEIYKFVGKAADEYEPLEELLRRHKLSFDEVLYQVDAFRSRFAQLVQQYNILDRNFMTLCISLTETLEELPANEDLQFMYCAMATDCGLLFDLTPEERDDEQDIRCWLEQKRRMEELLEFIRQQPGFRERLQQLKKSLKRSGKSQSHQDIQEEQALLFRLSLEHGFLYSGRKSNIYLENIGELVRLVNSNDNLKAVKPYVYMAVLSRKHKMMLNRSGYQPNFQNVFEYEEYNIEVDNGKNFDTYQSYLELYDHLRGNYLDEPEVDIAFSDYCFANLCNLSDWYYDNCQPNEEIPMHLRRKVESLMHLGFPQIVSYHEYENFDVIAFTEKNPVLSIAYDNALDVTLFRDAMRAFYDGKPISEFARQLYDAANAERITQEHANALTYAELFLLGEMEEQLREWVLDAAEDAV